MTEPLSIAAMQQAINQLKPTEKPGTAYTLGEPTSGHWCRNCGTASKVAADLLRVDDTGCTAIAVFYTCTTCG